MKVFLCLAFVASAILLAHAETCDDSQCVGKDDNVIVSGTNGGTTYCLCSCETAVESTCPTGYIFNLATLSCVLSGDVPSDDCNYCENVSCVGKDDNTLLATPITDLGYCKCTNGLSNYVPCISGKFSASLGYCEV